MTWFDEARLDDPRVLATRDAVLRTLAESGSRVRREAAAAREAAAGSADRAPDDGARPRAVVAAGPDSRLLRAVLEPWCPVPFVAWPGSGLPGWAGGLDLVVVLAPGGHDPGSASAVAEAVRRGCQVVVACPPGSLVAEHAAGRWSRLLPTTTGDPLAVAVVALEHLAALGLGPHTDPEEVATALDEVALACSPHRDLAVNPAKELAIALADTTPLVWGGSTLAARAARRVAEAVRMATGRSVLAADADRLLPLVEAARPRDLFADPVDGAAGAPRPGLLLLEDGADDPAAREQRERLRAAAAAHDVRTEQVAAGDPAVRTEVARYASLVLSGSYLAQYLAVGTVEE